VWRSKRSQTPKLRYLDSNEKDLRKLGVINWKQEVLKKNVLEAAVEEIKRDQTKVEEEEELSSSSDRCCYYCCYNSGWVFWIFISSSSYKITSYGWNVTHSRKPGRCLLSLWSPNWMWHWIPANSHAFSCVTGCVPSSIASRACTYSKFNCTGSRESMFWSEKKNLRLSSTVSLSSIPCSRRVLEGSIQFTETVRGLQITTILCLCNCDANFLIPCPHSNLGLSSLLQ